MFWSTLVCVLKTIIFTPKQKTLQFRFLGDFQTSRLQCRTDHVLSYRTLSDFDTECPINQDSNADATRFISLHTKHEVKNAQVKFFTKASQDFIHKTSQSLGFLAG